MQIVAINGSHRGASGYTAFLLGQLEAGARQGGAQWETVTLAERKINRCRGCFACQGKKSYLRCVYHDKDDVAAIFDRMRAADLIVYATPVYIFSMSSLLKSLLERFLSTADCSRLELADSGLIFHHVDRALSSKPFVLLVCCDNVEQETPHNVVSYFKTFSRFLGAPQVGTLVRGMGQAARHGRGDADRERFPHVESAHAAFRQAGAELATAGRIRRATERQANRSFMHLPLPVRLLWKLDVKQAKQAIYQQARRMLD